MAPINEMSAPVTALFKFYHTDTSKFLTAVATATQYPHDFFAVTVHSTTTTSRTMIHFAKDSAGVWISTRMNDAAHQSAVEITGSAIGSFQRVMDRVYFGDEENDLKMIIPRRSAGDTNVNTVYRAGIADPNAELVIERMISLDNWVTTGDGTQSASLDRMPTHRLFGDAAVSIEQVVAAKSVSTTYYLADTADLSTFTDGTTIGANDYISFNLFRFAKKPISQLILYINCDSTVATWTNNFYVPIVLPYNAELTDLESSALWSAYDFRQNTIMAEWQLNPYDNQFFRVRIRKAWFAKTGTPTWTSVHKFRFEMLAGDAATASNPAKVTINDLKVLKAPPTPLPYRIQWLQCEESESGSTLGWQFTAAHATVSKFNRQMAKQGVSCLKINGGGANSPVASLDFATPRDFVTFADGLTANTSCLLRYELAWRGLGKVGQLIVGAAGLYEWAKYTLPKIRFKEGANYKECKIGINAALRGGGIPQQVRFNTAEATIWSGSGGAMDWTAVDRVEIYGPIYNSTAIESYYFLDDIRLEWPKAMRPVNVFEPVDLHLMNAATEFTKAYLPAFATVAEYANAFGQAFLRATKYKTHGFGQMVYPDYEHSSFGLSGLTLQCGGGSQPFGVTLEIDPTLLAGTAPIDLDNFYVMSLNPTFEFSPPKKWGFIQFEQIPGSVNDEFEIWVAMPYRKNQDIAELIIKLHGNDGSDNADMKNYWEYRITGQQLGSVMADTAKEVKLVAQQAQWSLNALEDKRLNDLVTISNTIKNNPKDVQNFVAQTVKYLGKDRGGWYSGTFKWKKSDMLLVRDGASTNQPVWSDIRGQTFEITSIGGGGMLAIDNFMMKKYGSLEGTYWYKLLLQDDQGFLSPSSEPTEKVHAERENIQLNDIYVPNARDTVRVLNKQLYRLGGSSTEWRHVGDLAPWQQTYLDDKRDQDVGVIMPPEAYGPPKAKIIKAIGNTMFYANITDRVGMKWPYRMYRSEGFCPFRVDDFAAIDIPERKGSGITGLEEWFQYIMVWTQDGMYSTDKLLTQTPVKRSDKGCIADKSIQVTPQGVIWLSRDGLMMGNISQTDEKFFLPINPIFDGYTEDQLATAIGVYRDNYYYLFFDPSNTNGGRVVCCYLPDRLFSEFQSKALDVKSVCMWQGADDNNLIYFGRTNGEIAQFLDGETDNGTAIVSEFRSKDFTQPGIQYDKFSKALYLSAAKLSGSVNSTLKPYFLANQSNVDTAPVISAESTALKTFVSKAVQGDYGTHLGVACSASHRHKITEMVYKIITEEDIEFHV